MSRQTESFQIARKLLRSRKRALRRYTSSHCMVQKSHCHSRGAQQICTRQLQAQVAPPDVSVTYISYVCNHDRQFGCATDPCPRERSQPRLLNRHYLVIRSATSLRSRQKQTLFDIGATLGKT